MKEKLLVEFGPKFTQSQFEDFLKANYWERSFQNKDITTFFDLTLTEWVGAEQICYLFAWIRNLKILSHKVTVRLPFRNELQFIYSSSQLREIAEKYKNTVVEGPYIDSGKRVERRRRSAAFLMEKYGLFKRVELEESDFEHMADYSTYNIESRRIRENNHQIIGFTPFELKHVDPSIKYDTHFFDLISNATDVSPQTRGLFELQVSVQDLLKKYGCYNPFESKILSNVITQELFTNSLQHSFETNFKNLFQECYITAFLANKWERKAGDKFDHTFNQEKYPETLDFYKDKSAILKEINTILKKTKNKNTRPRTADLKSFTSHYKNQSYLEYTFVDFGDGIHHTLRSEFEKQKLDNRLEDEPLSEDFSTAHLDSQIIEYAFLMDSSKNPLDKRIECFDLVPRGLYFLIDMIRRYKGMLIVRSGKGKVIYDFSDKIEIKHSDSGPYAVLKTRFTISEALKHSSINDLQFFPGSMFTIVIPELEDGSLNAINHSKLLDTSLGAVRADDPQLAEYAYSIRNMDYQMMNFPFGAFRASLFKYVGVMLIYNQIMLDLHKSNDDIKVKEIYNSLLIEVNKVIDEAKGGNCIIFFDFAGLRSGNALWIKILYYLINTPKINEKTKAVIFNLPFDEQQIIRRIKENLTGFDYRHNKKKSNNPYEPFLYKPIPCVRQKIDVNNDEELVEWIGLKSAEDEKLLTSLFINKGKNYSVSLFESASNALGNLIVHEEGWVKSTFSGLKELNNLFNARQQQSNLDFIRSHIVDGTEKVLINGEWETKEKTVFLTSNGGFQLQYLTLYDLLHDKYVARYFAKCLLDQYAIYVQKQLESGDTGAFKDINQYSFTKIIAVTVSSQLIGIAIRDLIAEDHCYTFLQKKEPNQNGLDLAPELIMLSSYYSFDVEKPFEKIERDDRVLIVNDVISTGKLVGKLLDKIENVKNARINSVFSIADTRIPHSEKLSDSERQEEDSYFFDRFESIFITLASFDQGIDLRKFKGPYKGEATPKRINPLLNTIVELKAKHGEQQKVLFPDLPSFWKEMELGDEFLKIGHFQQNMTHNGYLTNMRLLFSGKKGIEILKKIKTEIENRGFQTSNGSPRKFIVNRLASINQQVDKITKGIRDRRYIENARLISDAILKFQQMLLEEDIVAPSIAHYRPDFIFYPIFSGIERTHYLKLSEIFYTHPDNIIGLQRFDTPKGWRFPFPAKRYNEVTRNQSVLILDAGSLTGDSLVQLIDNIGFLDVKEILVLSVVSRVEDFYREFYSRLKSINVKKLKSKDLNNDTSLLDKENVVPIEIVFGISLHIPVYASSSSCPFCEEIESLCSISDNSSHHSKPTHQVKEYIELRKNELKALNNATDELINARYLPVSRKKHKVDTKGLFNTRDFIGKIDSYRFYPEYFSELNDLQDYIVKNEDSWFLNPEKKMEVERILACLLHEPGLLELIESYGNGLDKSLKLYLLKYVFSENDQMLILEYDWSRYAQLRLCFLLAKDEILTIDYFIKILSWDDRDSSLLLYFKLWDLLYSVSSKQKDRDVVESLLKKFTQLFNEPIGSSVVYLAKNLEFPRILSHKYDLTKLRNYEKLDIPFYNLNKFVFHGLMQGRHFFLKENLNNILDAILSTKPSMEQIIAMVNRVLFIYDEELRPNIEIIVGDSAIKKHCKVLYGLLSKETQGILYYMDQLDEAYQKIVNIGQSEIDSVAYIFPAIQENCISMINHVLSTKSEQASFFSVCQEYPWCLNRAISDIKVKQNASVRIKHIPNDTLPELRLAIHRHVIDSILEEIVKNAKFRYQNGLELTFISEKTASQEYIKLTIIQNKPFIPIQKDKREGGLFGIVEHFVTKFEGSYDDNREESVKDESDFEIYLQLKLHMYGK